MEELEGSDLETEEERDITVITATVAVITAITITIITVITVTLPEQIPK